MQLLIIFNSIIFLITCPEANSQSSETDKQDRNQKLQSIEAKPSNTSSSDSGSIRDVRFEREASFGSTDEKLLGVIRTIEVDDQNRVFIADQTQKTIVVYQPDGSFLTSLGREGQGPAEFGTLYRSMMVIHDNRLYVTDTHGYFPHRAHVYRLDDLSFSHTINLESVNKDDYKELEAHYADHIYPLSDGTYLMAYTTRKRKSESFIYYVIQDDSGKIMSEPLFELQNLTYRYTVVTDGLANYEAFAPLPFFGKSLLAVSSENQLYIVKDTRKFEIDVYNLEGMHTHSFRHSFTNKPMDRRQLIKQYKHDEDLAGLGDGVAAEIIEEIDDLPDTWPALESMIIDDEDRLWIATITDKLDIHEWWVLTSTGEVITKFEWPQNEPIETVRNGYMYTVETEEETGLEEVIRYKIHMD